MACASDRRRTVLNQLKCLVDSMDCGPCGPCGPYPDCCGPPGCGPPGCGPFPGCGPYPGCGPGGCGSPCPSPPGCGPYPGCGPGGCGSPCPNPPGCTIPCGGPPCCDSPPSCCPPPCPPGFCCPPIIEMYDPCPKPAIPLACPGPITPLDPEIPVPHVACPTNPGGGVVIPIISPPAVPCIPLAGKCGARAEQPCVPCNPPTMMVCFRRGLVRPHRGRRSMGRSSGGGGGGCVSSGGMGCGGGGGKCLGPCKSRELLYSILHVGCDCIKRNGLQDQCPRTACQGRPACLYDPPMCCPGQLAMAKLEEHEARYERMYPSRNGLGGCGGGFGGGGARGCCTTGGFSAGGGGSGGFSGGCGTIRAEYLCYPAYFKMPPCSPNCCTPCSPFGGPTPCSPLTPPSTGPCKSVDQCCPIPQCCPPVPTIPLPPCPPVTVPSPPQIITNPVPLPVPTPIFPMCPCPPATSPC